MSKSKLMVVYVDRMVGNQQDEEKLLPPGVFPERSYADDDE